LAPGLGDLEQYLAILLRSFRRDPLALHCIFAVFGRAPHEVANPGDKALLLQMAQRWRELAEKAQKAPGPNGHRGA
jgi:hypothetical protein